jgi:hypothetical protein
MVNWWSGYEAVHMRASQVWLTWIFGVAWACGGWDLKELDAVAFCFGRWEIDTFVVLVFENEALVELPVEGSGGDEGEAGQTTRWWKGPAKAFAAACSSLRQLVGN